MNSASPKLTLAVVEDLFGKGWSRKKIAALYGVTPQFVSWVRYTYGGKRAPKDLVLDHFPWRVKKQFIQTSPYRLMRLHGEWVATDGEGMPEYKLKRLRSWYKMLREKNVVLEYNPEFPIVPKVSNKGGFKYQPRLPDDEDLLIRDNEHTTLTEEGLTIWRLPLPGEEP
ncbi:XRE family transcriptional regulator [Nocardia abscessus]|uniref:XRE family transcriptional regulator n=1 Tax=Nocardia abscessus TaxID=120957 RepID=UPI002455352E|nr:XRE family transcriptional regulator [Nocardia abscessus]